MRRNPESSYFALSEVIMTHFERRFFMSATQIGEQVRCRPRETPDVVSRTQTTKAPINTFENGGVNHE